MSQSMLKIRVEHENLETVYVAPDGDQILVYDHGHAYSYLFEHDDSTYRDWSELGVEHLRRHCDQHQLSFENLLGDDADPGFCICGRANTDLEVAELVNRVAICQDEIFESAGR